MLDSYRPKSALPMKRSRQMLIGTTQSDGMVWKTDMVQDEAPEAYELLRSMTPVPFALGEEFASKWQFIPYVEKGLANFCRVDIINVGGFTETMKVRRAHWR